VGLALTAVERLAFGVAHCQAGDRHLLAPSGISPLLETEESASRGSPVFISGSSQSDPSNKPCEPAVGSAAHSWGIAETRHPAFAGNRGQVHCPPSEASVADLAHFPEKPHERTGFSRFLGGPHNYVPGPVRLRDSRPRPSASGPLRRDSQPHRRIDCPASSRSFPLGQRSTLFVA
jgi:hypothetical protein